MKHALLALVLITASGCTDTRGLLDAGPPVVDAGPLEDSGPILDDAGPLPVDAGPPPVDAGPTFPPGTTCTPGYACPAGAVFTYTAGVGRCGWDVDVPSTSGVRPYCQYIDDGYAGLLWPLPSSDPDYTCPDGARYAPNSEVAYCLFEDFTLPPGAAADCPSASRLGFRWTCPPAP